MAKPTAQQQLFAELQDRFGPKVAKAFMDAIADLKSAADLQRLTLAVEAGDLAAAIEALNLDGSAFNDVLEAIRETYLTGGQQTAESLRRPAAVIRFDGRNPAAEEWLRVQSSDLVTRIVTDQRTAIREVLEANLAKGANPRTAALDIVGRVNRATGKREGGIVGLTSQQAGFVASAREELTSGDPADLKHYLTRTRRDKRFDRSVAKAIREEQPLPADIARKAVRAYENRLLQLRGETIGQVETFAALAAAKNETYRQAIESGKVAASAVTKIWRHFPNKDPRLTHMAMQGEKVGFYAEFVLPDGTRMAYPHAPGAPIEHTAGCHCQADYKIDFLSAVVP